MEIINFQNKKQKYHPNYKLLVMEIVNKYALKPRVCHQREVYEAHLTEFPSVNTIVVFSFNYDKIELASPTRRGCECAVPKWKLVH